MALVEGLISDNDASARLGVGWFALHMLAKTGRVPAINVSGGKFDRYAFTEADVERLASDTGSPVNKHIATETSRFIAGIESNPRRKADRIAALHRYILETGFLSRNSFGLLFRNGTICKTGIALSRELQPIVFVHPDDCLEWLRSQLPREIPRNDRKHL
jgi:hypothetical protein